MNSKLFSPSNITTYLGKNPCTFYCILMGYYLRNGDCRIKVSPNKEGKKHRFIVGYFYKLL